jgi:glyoxylase-like metal-dependent hydrolase (beta-lactamase superfamily II)
MRFIFEQIRTGGDRNLAYLIGDREARVAALVDPSYDPQAVVERAKQQGLSTEYIVNTHGHSDHTNGNKMARELTGARTAAFRGSTAQPDLPLGNGQILALGSLSLEVIHVPGHCDDHIVVYLAEQRVAITGDHLFVGKIGGTGTERAARTQHDSLRAMLDLLADEVTIWPGHDVGCRPSSSIGLEKATNPFLLRLGDMDEFLRLKRDWATFKAENGLI